MVSGSPGRGTVLGWSAALALVTACIPSVIESASDSIGDGSTETSEDSGEVGESTGSSTTGSTGDGDGDGDGDGESTTGTSTDGDDPACTPGTLDCPCENGFCDAGLVCAGGTCVPGEPDTDTTGGKHQCGWNYLLVWYSCGFEGPDPIDEFEMNCAEYDFPMEPGVPCPRELGIEGCCDANGDLWWCQDGFVEMQICE